MIWKRDYEWSTIQGVGPASNSKLDESEARGRYEMASAITPYTNCKARGPISDFEKVSRFFHKFKILQTEAIRVRVIDVRMA